LEVIDLGCAVPRAALQGVQELRLGAGTANIARAPAMTEAQCAAALQAGRDSVLRARAGAAQLFIAGEMGIGNTTPASAMACALLDARPDALTGRGTGLDDAGVQRKIE